MVILLPLDGGVGVAENPRRGVPRPAQEESARTRRSGGHSRRRRPRACPRSRVRRHGVILRPLGDVIVLMPPLAMGLDDLKTIVSAVESELQALRPDGTFVD